MDPTHFCRRKRTPGSPGEEFDDAAPNLPGSSWGPAQRAGKCGIRCNFATRQHCARTPLPMSRGATKPEAALLEGAERCAV